MGDTPWRQPEAAGGDALLVAVDVHVELALEHVDRFVGLGVAVPRRHLPFRQLVLEEEEGTVALLRRDLPRVEAAAGEPASVAFAGLAHQSASLPCRHLPVVETLSHEESAVSSCSLCQPRTNSTDAPSRSSAPGKRSSTRRGTSSRGGLAPTVEEAAADAGVSRATAYRYFPNQAALLAAAHPETGTSSLLPKNPPDDPEERVALVVEAFTKMIVGTESQQRTMLRLSLAADETRRPGRCRCAKGVRSCG